MNGSEDKMLPSEVEIKSSWEKDEGAVVSIICATFNHITYLEDALISFLRQKTNFAFEIIVHDDASTDGTREVIQRYKQAYSTIIKPILQEHNQFSKGNFKPSLYAATFAEGKYIALCEGDDYWLDSRKLQYQFDVLSKNTEITLCFHSAIEIDFDNNQKNLICDHYDISQRISFGELVRGRGGFMPTASLMFKKPPNTLMEILKTYPIGDFFIQVYMASLGKTYFMNKPMCVYRRNAINSWTTDQKSLLKRRTYNLNMCVAIDDFFNHLDEAKKISLYEPCVFYIKNYLSTFPTFKCKVMAAAQLLTKEFINIDRTVLIRKLIIAFLESLRSKAR